MKIYEDKDFLREYSENGKIIPMTKKEIRLLTIANLGIEYEDIILDIGSGTGTLTCQAAQRAKKVYAVERERLAAELTRKNADRLGLDNVIVIEGKAGTVLDDLKDLIFDGIIIGGTGGELEPIISFIKTNLKSGGRICANFITLENLLEAKKLLINYLDEIKISQVGVTNLESVRDFTMMRAENPVYILSGGKNACDRRS